MAFTGNYTTDTFIAGLFSGEFNFASDTFRIALYTDAATLTAATTAYTTDGEVTDAGYTAGGALLTSEVGATGNTSYVSFEDVSWSGAITARGALIYKDDGSDNPAVCVLDFGNTKTSTATFTIQFPVNTATTGLLRIS